MNREYIHNQLSYMFLCVIAQAVKDAFLTKVKVERTPQNPRSKGAGYYDVVQARYWLTEDEKDFYTVCEWANVSPDRIRNKVKELLDIKEPERTALVRKMMREMYGKKVKKYM